MGDIRFGTDGWRAVIAEDFTFDNVKKVSQAIANYIKDEGRSLRVKDRRVIVGYDTRFLSREVAELAACVMAANRIKTILTDRPTPSPSIAYAIKDRGLIGGIVITASHNPAMYNGIKYKAHYAGSADIKITKMIEDHLDEDEARYISMEEARAKGLLKKEDVIPRHLAFLKSYADLKLLRRSRLKVLVDSMYGTGDDYMSKLIGRGRCKIDTIHTEANPGFGGINPEPMMPNLKELICKMRLGGYDIGLATDGDSDRLAVAMPNGRLLTGHKVIVLLLLHLLEDKGMRGDVVQTVCGTVLIDKICKRYRLKMHETPVGFKYICGIMREEGVLIGGEETGGIAFKNSIPERDGILSGLLILEMAAMKRKSISEILKGIDEEYGRYEYRRLDVRYPDGKKLRLMKHLKNHPPKYLLGKPVVKIKDMDGYKFICEDDSWLMLRLSGTEPILRIYAEASSEAKALKILEFGKRLAHSI